MLRNVCRISLFNDILLASLQEFNEICIENCTSVSEIGKAISNTSKDLKPYSEELTRKNNELIAIVDEFTFVSWNFWKEVNENISQKISQEIANLVQNKQKIENENKENILMGKCEDEITNITTNTWTKQRNNFQAIYDN